MTWGEKAIENAKRVARAGYPDVADEIVSIASVSIADRDAEGEHYAMTWSERCVDMINMGRRPPAI